VRSLEHRAEAAGGSSPRAVAASSRSRAQARPSNQDAKVRGRPLAEERMKRSLLWDLGLGLAAAVYLDLVLFQGIEVPLFGFAWIAAAGTRMLELHRSS
jgi:hypothetical protein